MAMTNAVASDTYKASESNKTKLWAGRIISILPALFLIIDGTAKLLKPAAVVEATVKLGYPEGTIVGLGLVLLGCTILYLIPRTSVVGAILLTGYLGGAIATHVRVGGPLFPVIFPLILGVMLWGGLYLRNERLRALLYPKN